MKYIWETDTQYKLRTKINKLIDKYGNQYDKKFDGIKKLEDLRYYKTFNIVLLVYNLMLTLIILYHTL